MALLLSLCYQLFAFPTATIAAPVTSVASQLSAADGNLTALKTEIAPAWASTASYRGTADILWSCLLTLTACIYNAIHLNVPRSHETPLQLLRRKLTWVAMALFAPELVLYTAYSQYSEARKLVKVLNELRFEENEKAEKGKIEEDESADDKLNPEAGAAESHKLNGKEQQSMPGMMGVHDVGNIPSYERIDKATIQEDGNKPDDINIERGSFPADFQDIGIENWIVPQDAKKPDKVSIKTPDARKFDLAYGFYVIMGGFGIDLPTSIRFPSGQGTLTSRGVMYLAQQGKFLDISPNTISDKSKATITTKGLICIQVTWMVLQCIVRKGAGYPLTLLEIHTMVHVLCALLLYTFWFAKPLDITEPTIVDKSDLSYANPLMLSGSHWDPTESAVEASASEFPQMFSNPVFTFTDLASKTIKFDEKLFAVLFFLLPALYGGIHLSAWGFEFPSHVEALLWKIACIDLAMTSIPIAFLVDLDILSNTKLGWGWQARMGEFLCILILYILLFAYAFSRFYIVTEAFVSLRYVPIGVYAAVPWTQNIPHI